MAAVDWNHYEIGCFPESVQIPSAPAASTVAAPLASRGARLAAQLIDLAISGIACAPGFYLAQMADHPGDMVVARGLLALGVALVAAVQASLLTWNGQTIGKRVLGVRIFRCTDGGNPGFLRAVLLRSVLPLLYASVTCVLRLFALIDIRNILGEERCCLHDYLAGTKVVEV
jgi:uncharacterized RDD family membrane protein YckC